MKKIINIAFSLLFGFIAISTVGCYEQFEEPSMTHLYTDADFTDSQIISIRELKQKYASIQMGGHEDVTEDLVIRGKVISSDRDGNVYKSLYILDHSDSKGSSAIELRLYASNYVQFPVGTMVYVKLQGLTMGDYRGMLSVGAPSNNPEYANSNIEETIMLKEHIFRGKPAPMDSRDTVVVTKDNYKTLLNDDMLARLVRFERVESAYGTSKWGFANTFPNYFADAENNFTWNESLGEVDSDLIYPPMAFYGQDPNVVHNSASLTRYFGSSWYTYDRESTDNLHGQYVIRCSGYARFRQDLIPNNGTYTNITAIYTVFKNASNSDNMKAYQLVINSGEDLVEVH